MKSLYKYTVLAIFCLALGACAFIKNEDPAVRLMVTAGTFKAIEAAPVVERAERAAKIAELSDIALEMLSDESVALEAVYDRVVAEIRWQQLSPGDQLLYRTLLTTLKQRIAEHIEAKALDGERITTARIFVGWIRAAATDYASMLE